MADDQKVQEPKTKSADTEEQPTPKAVELLDFWAEWCGPCKIMEPIFEEIEKDYHNKMTITKINVDEEEHRALVEKYNVMSIPTYLFMKNGEVVDQLIGAQAKETLTKKLDALL